MIHTLHYHSSVGEILLASRENSLIGLRIDGQANYLSSFNEKIEENPIDAVLLQAKKWLDSYFRGEKPEIEILSLNPIGTEFRKSVWKVLTTIPYGKTMTYGEIANQIAKEKGITRMSAQAVGGAVGHNPISIIIPCHRVIGANGNLTGFTGGMDKKIALLELEGFDMDNFFIP